MGREIEGALKYMARYGLDRDQRGQDLLAKAFQSPKGWSAFRRYAAPYIRLYS